MLPDTTQYLAANPELAAWLAKWKTLGGCTDVSVLVEPRDGDVPGGYPSGNPKDFGGRYLSSNDRQLDGRRIAVVPFDRALFVDGRMPFGHSPYAKYCAEWVTALAQHGLSPNDWGTPAEDGVPGSPLTKAQHAELTALAARVRKPSTIPILVEPVEAREDYLYVEPSATTRALRVGSILDPQHGGSRIKRPVVRGDDVAWEVEAGACGYVDTPHLPGQPWAACSAAQKLAALVELQLPPFAAVVLRQDAGADDFVAAAIVLGTRLSSDEAAVRVRKLAASDCAAYDSPPWQPGQRLGVVSTDFPGLARLLSCRSIPAERRVRFASEWAETGDVVVKLSDVGADAFREMAGWYRDELEAMSSETVSLRDLDVVARKELENSRKWMCVEVLSDEAGPLVAVVNSTLAGPSGGAARWDGATRTRRWWWRGVARTATGSPSSPSPGQPTRPPSSSWTGPGCATSCAGWSRVGVATPPPVSSAVRSPEAPRSSRLASWRPCCGTSGGCETRNNRSGPARGGARATTPHPGTGSRTEME